MQPGQKADNFNVAKRDTYVYWFAVTVFVFQCVGILILLVWCTLLNSPHPILESAFRKTISGIVRIFKRNFRIDFLVCKRFWGINLYDITACNIDTNNDRMASSYVEKINSNTH